MQMTLFDPPQSAPSGHSRVTESGFQPERQRLVNERKLLQEQLGVLQLKQEISLYRELGIDVPPYHQQVVESREQQVIEGAYTQLGDLVDWREWRSEIDSISNFPFLAYDSKAGGGLAPYFQTENDFHEARMVSRYLFDTNEHCKAALERLTDYVIGKGMSIEFSAKASDDKDLAKAVQSFVDDWARRNKWIGNREREFFLRSRRDGEVGPKLSHVGEGRTKLRFVEPEKIVEPNLTDESLAYIRSNFPHVADWSEPQSWTYGVHTAEGDVVEHQGYFVGWSHDPNDWDYVPGDRMKLLRSNVDEDVKRGIPDTFPIQSNLMRCAKLLGAILTGATSQAKIAFIKEMEPGASEAGARSMSSTDVDFQRRVSTLNGGQKTFNAKIHPYGTTLIIPQGRKYHPGPMGSTQGPLYVTVLAAGLRAISVRWGFPEFIFSGDASTNAFASSAAAGSAFDVAKQGAQTKVASEEEELLWAVVNIGWRAGVFDSFSNRINSFEQCRQLISLSITPTEIDTTEKGAETDRNKIMHDAGLMSKRTWASKEGLDFDKEKEQGAEPVDEATGLPADELAAQEGGTAPQDESIEAAAEEIPGGELGDKNRLTWTRNVRAIKEIVDEFKSGEADRILSEELLVSIGLRPERARRILDEANESRKLRLSESAIEAEKWITTSNGKRIQIDDESGEITKGYGSGTKVSQLKGGPGKLDQVSQTSDGRPVYKSGGVHFTVPQKYAGRKDIQTVMVTVDKFDSEWSKDKGFHIPKGGGGAEVQGKRQGVKDFMEKGGGTADKPMEMSKVTAANGLSFVDGRHRFAELRDSGIKSMPVVIDSGEVDKLRRLGVAETAVERGEKWITTQSGKHIEIDDEGEIKKGFGKGTNVRDLKDGPGKEAASKKQPASSSLTGTKKVGGKHRMPDGSELPAHIPKNIPPAWTDVQIATDPNSKLLVKGRDAKGRVQSVYSQSHATEQAAKKFARTSELRKSSDQIRGTIRSDIGSADPSIREPASVMALIESTGMRPGSTRDTKAEKQAYGATTIEGRHVNVDANGAVSLQFTGKKGVSQNVAITDPEVASMLKSRKAKAGNGGRLFDTDDSDLRDYSKRLGKGGFKPKDFRTAKGTSTAVESIKSISPPRNAKEYKSKVKEVAVAVSKQLGNTPTIALQSYIDPSVFTNWRGAAGV